MDWHSHAYGDDASHDASHSQPWPELEPLPSGLPPVAPFDPDLLPEALRDWVVDIADRIQCPPDFPAVAAIVAASAVVGRQIGIYPKRRDDWLVIPNLWGAVVGRPSIMKSPPVQEIMKAVRRLVADERNKFQAAMDDYLLANNVHEVLEKENKKSREAAIKEALSTGADPHEAARKAKADLPPSPVPPTLRRFETNDSTVEKLGELLNENPRGILVFRDELTGLLRTMDRDGHEGDRAFYLEAWNGSGRFTYDRIGRGTLEIDAVCISLLGGIQPGPLRAYIAAASAGGAGDDGLLQRIQLLVWPDSSGEWRNIDRWPNSEAKNRAFEVFKRLDRITPNVGEDVPGLRFTHDAQEIFDDWRAALERRLRTEEMPAPLESHLGKYRSLMPSLALLFHLIDNPDDLAVGDQHARRAIAWLEYLETHARRLYAQRVNPQIAAAIALAGKLNALPEHFTARDVWKRGWEGLDQDEVKNAIPVLVDFGFIRPLPQPKNPKGGRPTERFEKNPKLVREATPKTPETSPANGFGGFGGFSPSEFEENFGPDVVEI